MTQRCHDLAQDYPLRLYPDPILLQKSVPMTRGIYFPIILEAMQATLMNHNGMGLAAIQIGVPLRLFIFVPKGKDPSEMIICMNPEIVWASPPRLSPHAEGCLSIPGFNVNRLRSERVKLRWEDLHLERQYEETFHGLDAVCVQHEMDHLNGILLNSA